ncbi:MAG: hypothetical protein IJT94_16295 [Oscillibacter sp.]|nr:hypothetical protein [Oscillibacter sp.]
MEREYVPVKGIGPNSRFENELNRDTLLRTMERVWAIHLERETGVPYKVNMRLVPADGQESPAPMNEMRLKCTG